jgi:hypothetical protein
MPKVFYKSLSMVARHFRISEVGRHKVNRHYTVANCMEPKVYSKYLSAIKGESIKKEDFIPDENDKKFTVTAKNYKIKGGLSERLN